MSMQKYRADCSEPNPDGSRSWYARWMGGLTLSKVTKCACEDGNRRAAYITGEPDSWSSVPAATRVRGKYVRGFLSFDDGCPVFHADDKRVFISRDYRLMLANVRDESENRRLFPESWRYFRASRLRRLAFAGFDYGEHPEY